MSDRAIPPLFVGAPDGLHRIEDGAPELLTSGEVRAIDASRGSHYAVVDERRLLADAREVATLPRPGASLLALGGRVLVGTARAHLLAWSPASGVVPVKGFDAAPGRRSWYTPWGGPPDTRSLAATDGALYANVHVGGIVRSAADGATWQPTIDIDADVHDVWATPELGELVLAATAQGLAESRDRGVTWRFATAGLHGAYCRAVTVSDGYVLVTASLGHASRKAALYRRPLEGTAAFEKCAVGLPEWFGANIDTRCIDAVGEFVAFGGADGRLFLSTDAGATWRELPVRFAAIRCLRFAR